MQDERVGSAPRNNTASENYYYSAVVARKAYFHRTNVVQLRIYSIDIMCSAILPFFISAKCRHTLVDYVLRINAIYVSRLSNRLW